MVWWYLEKFQVMALWTVQKSMSPIRAAVRNPRVVGMKNGSGGVIHTLFLIFPFFDRVKSFVCSSSVILIPFFENTGLIPFLSSV